MFHLRVKLSNTRFQFFLGNKFRSRNAFHSEEKLPPKSTNGHKSGNVIAAAELVKNLQPQESVKDVRIWNKIINIINKFKNTKKILNILK